MIRQSTRRLLAFVAMALLAPAAARAAADWKPIDPAELALRAPKVQADAAAEALLWEVRIADEIDTMAAVPTTVYDHYLRVKIFTERGLDAHATVDIPFSTGIAVRDVEARTTRPDGTTVELKRSDVYQRTLIKAGDIQIKVVSFAVPGIQTGAIVEYRWREVHRESIANYLRLPFSREIPVHVTRYYLRPIDLPGFTMMAQGFNGSFEPLQRSKDGFAMVSLSNVPADTDEPHATPEFERRPWMFVYYELGGRSDRATFWPRFSKALYDEYSERSKPNDDIRRLAGEAAPGNEDERLAAFVRTARSRVKRIDTGEADPADVRRARDNRNAADALKRGLGTGDDLVVLVLALARAAGLDARVAAAPNRADVFHKPTHDNPYFVRGRLVAARTASGWSFVDPANDQSPTGALRWYYEQQEVLVADPKTVTPVYTPLSPASRSGKKRIGTLRLLEDGTLEGECRLEFSGHWAEMFRRTDGADTDADRDKALRQLLTTRLPGAEISDLRFENLGDPALPYINVYRIRVPGYAQRTGARLFLQPMFFQKGIDAVFPSAARASDVYFPFPWTEDDRVTIDLPAGFALEQAEVPPPIDAGAGAYTLTIGTVNGARLVAVRQFSFGLKDQILFGLATYPKIKQFFDLMHSRDAHTLVLRRAEPAK
jgi:hypothetical protein